MLQDLKTTINKLSLECCSEMTDQERDSFFEYQEARIEDGEAYKAKYTSIRTYYKGKNKGKCKIIYNIDGFRFSKLWALLRPYAYQSSINSHGFDPYSLEEDLSEMKLWLFKIMRFFGPEPTGIKLSEYFPLLVNNYLTNQFNSKRKRHSSKEDLFFLKIKKQYKKLLKSTSSKELAFVQIKEQYPDLEFDQLNSILFEKSQTTYRTTSIFEEMYSTGEEGDNTCIADNIASDSFSRMEFDIILPENLKDGAELLIGGCKMKEVAAEMGVSTTDLKQMYAHFLDL